MGFPPLASALVDSTPPMNFVVLLSLVPVLLLVTVGFAASKAQWLKPGSIKDLSTLLFMVLTPALMFRTMGRVHLDQLDLTPIAAYFPPVLLLFAAVVWHGRLSRHSAAMAISATFGNTVAIGIPLVGLAYGDAALVTLFTVVAVHALILLTASTVVFELAVAHETHAKSQSLFKNTLTAVKNGIVNPATLPTLLGLLFAYSGWPMPEALDNTLKLLSQAMGPIALMLVGASLASARVGAQWRGALVLTALKNVLLPCLVVAWAYALGVRGMPLTVLAVAAAMPIGANAFLFSQRYNIAQERVTAGVAVSTALSLLSISVVMAAMALWSPVVSPTLLR